MDHLVALKHLASKVSGRTFADGSTANEVLASVIQDVDGETIEVSGGGGVLTALEVESSTSTQVHTPSVGIDGFSTVTVYPIQASAISGLTSDNVRKGVTILGVDGAYPDTKEVLVNPTTSSQVIEALESPFINRVVVTKVTSAIDSNIVPGNIKQGVSILGVDGTLSGGGSTALPCYSEVQITNADQLTVGLVGIHSDGTLINQFLNYLVTSLTLSNVALLYVVEYDGSNATQIYGTCENKLMNGWVMANGKHFALDSSITTNVCACFYAQGDVTDTLTIKLS